MSKPHRFDKGDKAWDKINEEEAECLDIIGFAVYWSNGGITMRNGGNYGEAGEKLPRYIPLSEARAKGYLGVPREEPFRWEGEVEFRDTGEEIVIMAYAAKKGSSIDFEGIDGKRGAMVFVSKGKVYGKEILRSQAKKSNERNRRGI